MTVTNQALLLAVWNNNVNEVRRLLNDNNVNINDSMDETGWTPLILAIKNKNPEIVNILLNDSKLDINHEDMDGWTAYKHAILLDKQFPNDPDRRRIIELLEANPRLNKDLGKNESGEFAFDIRRNMGGKKTKRRYNKVIKKRVKKTQNKRKRVTKKYKNKKN
jgi:ankyrin repeat protein